MIFFIIHWRISPYSSYFITMLLELMKSYQVVLVDCFDSEDDLRNHGELVNKGFYTHFLNVHPQIDPHILKENILNLKSDWNLVISNSSRKGLKVGIEISQTLGCSHFLFEHLGCFTDQTYTPETSMIEKFKKLDQVIVPSEIMQQALLKYLPDNKVHVNYLRPISEYFKPLPNPQIVIHNRLLYAGKFLSPKGIMDFAKTNRILLEERDLELLVVGSGVEAAELHELAANYPSLKVQPTVNPFDLVQLIDSSLAVVVPSLFESYSMIVVESLLRGVPVVCHRTGIAFTLDGKIPGLYFLEKNQTLTPEVLEQIKSFSDRAKLRKLMHMFLASDQHALLDLIKRDHEQH